MTALRESQRSASSDKGVFPVPPARLGLISAGLGRGPASTPSMVVEVPEAVPVIRFSREGAGIRLWHPFRHDHRSSRTRAPTP